MGRPFVPPEKILAHPMRRAVLAHLVEAGGISTNVKASAHFNVHRQTTVNHARLLSRFGYIWLSLEGRGDKRALTLHITPKGRKAVARVINPEPKMMEASP